LGPALLVALAAVFFGAALAAATTRYVPQWHARVPNGVPIAAHFGDRIVINPLVAGTVSFVAYPLTVQRTHASRGRPAIFSSSGNDTYEITNDRDGALDVGLERLQPAISPWLIALLLLCAAAAAVGATVQALPADRAPSKMARARALQAAIFFGSLVLFLIVPQYLHNDEVGDGINWGYLGWGYVDTLRALPLAVAQSGLLGLTTVESLGKPILLPLMALPFVPLLGPLHAAILVSSLFAALAALGVYRVGRLIYDSSVGLLAAALFAFSPLVLAYATAFYLDIPYVAFVIWSAVFFIIGLRERNRSMVFFGALLGIAAVGVRNPVIAGLYFLSLLLLLLAARIKPVTALTASLLGAVASFLGAVFLWPFLWIDTEHRLPFILVARLLFDQYHHLAEPFTSRASTMAVQTFVHADPLSVGLFFIGLAAAIIRRDIRILWLAAGVVIARLFVAPTAFYLAHYWFYIAPFFQLVAASTIVLLTARLRAGAVVAASAAVFAWSALYFPYTASAALGCGDFPCSVRRWGVDEPVYGLKEAAQWIRDNLPRGTGIGALAAPHILQVQLDGYPVQFVHLGTNRRQQEAALNEAGVRYLVANAWSQYRDRERLLVPGARIVWRSSSRAGFAQIFALARYKSRNGTLDAPAIGAARRLVLPTVDRIVVYPRRASYHGFFADRQVVTVSEAVHPLTGMQSLLALGGGALLLSTTSNAAPFVYERPIVQEYGGISYALPTLAGMQPVISAPMTPASAQASGGRTVLFGQVVPRGDQQLYSDIFEVRARARKPFRHPGSVVIGAVCERTAVALPLVWIDAFEVRGYAAAEKPLLNCLHNGGGMVGYFSSAEPRASTHVAASVSLLWNGDNAQVRVQPVPLAIMGAHRLGRVNALPTEDAVRSFIEGRRVAAIVAPSFQRRFDLEAVTRKALSRTTVLLTFAPPSGLPQQMVQLVSQRCSGCRKIRGAALMLRGATEEWVWSFDDSAARAKALSLDLSTLAIREGRSAQVALQFVRAGRRGCAQWDLGFMSYGHTLLLRTDRFLERGCRLTPGTQLAFVIYAPPQGMTLSVKPELRVWR